MTLELTPKDPLVVTDALNFADLGLDFAYGRSTFQKLGDALGQKITVAFDLASIDEIETVSQRSTGNRDLRPFLKDGTLDVVMRTTRLSIARFWLLRGSQLTIQV